MFETFGRLIYYAIWPVLVLYTPFTHRTRVVVRCGTDVLLVKGWLSSGMWQLPGGGVHWGEPHDQSAVRELFEETGVTVAAVNLQQVATGRMYELPGYAYTLYAVDIPAKSQLRLQKGEITNAVWLPQDEVLANNALRADARILLQQFANYS